MPAGLVVEPLQRSQIRTVYPLLRLVQPSLGLAGWLRYGYRLTRGGGLARQGVLVARHRRRLHPSGAVCYRCHSAIGDRPVLTAEHLVSADLVRSEEVMAALIRGLELAAAELGCTSVRLVVDRRAPGLAELLLASGHSAVGVTFGKSIAGAPA